MESFSNLGKFQSVKKPMSKQREDVNLTEEVINYKENGTYASDCPANRKRSIRKKAGKLGLSEGEVYYEKKASQSLLKYREFKHIQWQTSTQNP